MKLSTTSSQVKGRRVRCVREDTGGVRGRRAPVVAVRSGVDDEVAVGAVSPADARAQAEALGAVWEAEEF